MADDRWAELGGARLTDAVAQARAATDELRWHPALRRDWPAVRLEVGVRAAWSGARLDGVNLPLALVRDVARGAAPGPGGPTGQVLAGHLRLVHVVQVGLPAPGTHAPDRTPLPQLLARWHLALVGDDQGAVAGRLRTDDQPTDLRGLGPAPTGPQVAARVAALAQLRADPPAALTPLLRAAVVLGELLAVRPFARGSGAVAHAALRHLLAVDGVDPVGVLLPEAGWADRPAVHLDAAARYTGGTPDGVGGWLVHCARSVVAGAQAATAVADAVRAGRLGED